MSEGRKIYDGKGKLLGTFRPAKGDDSSGGGCLGIIVALVVFIYLIMQGWSGIVKPTYHFAPVDSVGTELQVRSMTFEKGRFLDRQDVQGYFMAMGSSRNDTLRFTGTYDDELHLMLAEHDLKMSTFKSGEEIVVQWDSDGVALQNRNPNSAQYGQIERWEGGMDSVQWWMALILVLSALWVVRKLVKG